MPSCRSLPVFAALLLSGLSLSGCGTKDPNVFAPACPRAAILADAADILRYRPDATGQDLTDLVLEGRITGVSGACTRANEPGLLDTTVRVALDLSHGPAARTRTEDVTLFIAVTEGGRILDKKLIPLHAVFPENGDRVRLSSSEVQLSLPITNEKSGAAYAVMVGFQLTPEELARVRARGTH